MTTTSLLTEVRWAWDWPAWATALLLATAALWVIAVYSKEHQFVGRRTRTVLASLRLVAVALVLLMLAQPTIERHRVAPPRLVLLLDRSASMDTRDVAAADLPGGNGATPTISRMEAWEQILSGGEQPLLDELRSRFSVDALRFDATAEPGTDQPNEDRNATRLGDAIDDALRQLPGPRPAAIVVMTDGVSTAGMSLADAATRARTLGVPLYTVALGSDRPRPDLSLDDVLVEEVVFPGDRLQIEAVVRAAGFAGKYGRATLRRTDSGEVLAETDLTFPADGVPQPVRLALRPTEPGPMRVALEIEPQPGEDDAINNRAKLTIDVRDRPIRTLLVASTPSFEYRALKSLLERDPAIDLRVRLQDADADFASVDNAALREFPATEAELLEYDVVLLGDVDPQLLPRQTWDLLEKFVSVHGGGLALIAGPRFMPQAFGDIDKMRVLLPIELHDGNTLRADASATGSIKIQPTAIGSQEPSLQLGETLEESAAIWAELPPALWSLDAATPKPGVRVLAAGAAGAEDGEPRPIVMRRYVGAGEVLMHATDETWRWRWRNDDRYFARYWGQAVRRLARGRALRGIGSLTSNQAEYRVGDAVTLRARLQPTAPQADDSLTVELGGDSSPTREIRLPRNGSHAHVFETVLHDLPADRYTARLTTDGGLTLTAEFVVAAPPGELAQLVVNASGLANAARTTGGKFYTAKSAGRLRDELPAANPTSVEQLPDEPLWNSPWLLAALCVALASEWLLRRRSGML